MAVATVTDVEKHFGKKVLFEHLNFTVYEGERVGFIGDNGAGKSTLFKMLTGEVEPDTGTVQISKGTKVGYLVQNPVFRAGKHGDRRSRAGVCGSASAVA